MTNRWLIPDNELSAAAAVSGILNRSDGLVLRLAATEVFTTGVRFRFEAFKRHPTVELATWGFGRPEARNSSAPPLIGFEWADGSVSTNLPMPRNNAGGLRHGGGGGGQAAAYWNMHLDHLPPPGPFYVVTAWPYFDLPERIVAFDATTITKAAGTVETLWEAAVPETLGTATPEKPNTALVIPKTGWFADHYDPTPPPPRDDGLVFTPL